MKLVIKDPVVKINDTTLGAADGTDISNYIRSLTLNANIEEQESTAFGDGAKNSEAGLEDNTLALELLQDADLSNLDGVLWPLRGTKVFVSITLKDAAVSAANPKLSGEILIAGSYPLGGSVGQVATSSVTWRVCSVVTRATS